jgi:hypothetical protein
MGNKKGPDISDCERNRRLAKPLKIRKESLSDFSVRNLCKVSQEFEAVQVRLTKMPTRIVNPPGLFPFSTRSNVRSLHLGFSPLRSIQAPTVCDVSFANNTTSFFCNSFTMAVGDICGLTTTAAWEIIDHNSGVIQLVSTEGLYGTILGRPVEPRCWRSSSLKTRQGREASATLVSTDVLDSETSWSGYEIQVSSNHKSP